MNSRQDVAGKAVEKSMIFSRLSRKNRCFSRVLALSLAIGITVSGTPAQAFSLPRPMPGETQGISIAGSTVLIKGLTHQANKAFVNGREMVVQKDGILQQDVIIPLGETTIVVSVVDLEKRTKIHQKTIRAKENAFFAAGIADGTLNFTRASEGEVLERDSKKYKDGFEPDGKVSYYMTGKLQGKYLFKSSLDTDRTKEAQQNKMFTHVDPDDYYPVYGDNSTVGYDVNTQGKFYGLFEWDKSGAVIGNYQTQVGGDDETRLVSYHRTLYGAKAHFETPERTVYGDPVGKHSVFIAEARQHAGHSELLATGGSLYYLRHRNILQGSEQVRIEVRDKYSGLVLQSVPQTPDVDYEIKDAEGRILFRKPVHSVAFSDAISTNSVLEGNPVYVVVNYEYNDQDAFAVTSQDLNDKTGGLRLSQHLGDHLRGGITFLREKKEDAKTHQLLGADTTVKIGKFTQVNLEAAHTKAEATNAYTSYDGGYQYNEVSINNLADGMAYRTSFQTSLGEYIGKEKEFLDVSGYWHKQDKDFSPTDALFQSGTNKYGFEIGHRIDANDRVRALYEKSELQDTAANVVAQNQLQARQNQLTSFQWIHDWEKVSATSEYSFREKRQSLSIVTDEGKTFGHDHLLAERLEYRLSSSTILSGGQQFGLNDINQSFTSVGMAQKIYQDTWVRGQAGAGPLGNSVLAGVERVLDSRNTFYANRTFLNSAIDGKTSITAVGSNTRISETASLRRERQFVSSEVRGIYGANVIHYDNQVTPELSYDLAYERRDETQSPVLIGSAPKDAASASLAYAKPDVWKGYSRAEWRTNSDDTYQVLTDTQAEYRVTRDLYLFGEHEFSQASNVLSKIDKKQAGLAFRPVDYDWFNALFKYTRFNDFRPQNLTSADGGFLTMKSQSHVLATEYAVDLAYLPGLLKHFQLVQKLAFKKENILAANPTNTIFTPENLDAFLWIHRLNYHLTKRMDVAAEYRTLKQRGSDISDKEGGILLEVTFQIIKNMAVGAGFNFTSFTDNLLERSSRTKDSGVAQGFFLRLQGKY